MCALSANIAILTRKKCLSTAVIRDVICRIKDVLNAEHFCIKTDLIFLSRHSLDLRETKSLISTLTSRVSISPRLISTRRLSSVTDRHSEQELSRLLLIRQLTVS